MPFVRADADSGTFRLRKASIPREEAAQDRSLLSAYWPCVRRGAFARERDSVPLRDLTEMLFAARLISKPGIKGSAKLGGDPLGGPAKRDMFDGTVDASTLVGARSTHA